MTTACDTPQTVQPTDKLLLKLFTGVVLIAAIACAAMFWLVQKRYDHLQELRQLSLYVHAVDGKQVSLATDILGTSRQYKATLQATAGLHIPFEGEQVMTSLSYDGQLKLCNDFNECFPLADAGDLRQALSKEPTYAQQFLYKD